MSKRLIVESRLGNLNVHLVGNMRQLVEYARMMRQLRSMPDVPRETVEAVLKALAAKKR